MSKQQTLFDEVVHILQNELSSPRQLWQIAIIAAALTAAWFWSRGVTARAERRLSVALGAEPGVRADVLRFSMGGFERLAFPLSAFAFTAAGGLALTLAGFARVPDLQLLRVGLLLLGAMAVIRLFVYVLRRSFPRATWIGTFELGIAATIWIIVALYATGLLRDLIDYLDSVRIPLGRSPLTLWDILAGMVSVVLTVFAALWAGSLVESRLMKSSAMSANSRVVLARLVKALLMAVAVLMALSFAGIDLTVLSVFGGALGVGLGLGLQRIASNYVSGFIILLDRSLSIGDMIVVDKFSGTVSEITARYTVINALDGTETIVPNEMLVSTPVVNHSYSDNSMQVVMRLQIAYGADVDRALQILVDIATAQQRVMKTPAPSAFVTGLAPDGIDLQLAFWIRDSRDGSLGTRSDIARSVLKSFDHQGIEIPAARRDVRMAAGGDPGSVQARASVREAEAG